MTFGIFTLGLVVSLLAQANIPVPPLPAEGQASILTAMYNTIIHNPNSMFVIIILCIFAWLMDTLPFIDSKYVTHYSTLLGGAIYWMFCHPSNVPKTFPYAWPVLLCIGCACGFAAGLLHKIIIGRLIEFIKSKIPGSDPKPAESKTTMPLLLLAGLLSFGALGVVTTGCTTTPTARQLSLIKQVSYNGTYFALQEKPLWRPGFVVAERELRGFSTSTNDVGMTEIVAIINRLPVKELSSAQARLFINNGTLFLEQVTGGGAIPAEKLNTPRQIAGALADGIELGTTP